MPTTKHITGLADAIERAFRGAPGRTIKPDVWTYVYRTKGGTVIVASSGTGNDHGQPRDLMAVPPYHLPGVGRVIPLYIGTNPDVVRELSAELERRTE